MSEASKKCSHCKKAVKAGEIAAKPIYGGRLCAPCTDEWAALAAKTLRQVWRAWMEASRDGHFPLVLGKEPA